VKSVKVVAVACLLVIAAGVLAAGAWPKFKGQWFDIKYPPGFKAVGRDKNTTGKYDGVSFLSPDKTVEFYVYSPRFQGDSWWMTKRTGETLGGQSTDDGAKYTIKYGTYTGPKGKYSRSYADITIKADGSRHVFGFRYNSQTYDKYKPKYVIFKSSLKQFAD
jgi:hypothetical protein